jgi:hypothetical protein
VSPSASAPRGFPISTDVRQGSIAITWTADGIGQVTLDGVVFARVEWSERRQQFCIEDAAGACLRHVGSIKGMSASKDEAAALAINMVRDRRMPDPETAGAEHRERQRAAKAKRARQPAEIRKREEQAEEDRRQSDASTKRWRAEAEEDAVPPLYEALADAFDFADPELWKSNSFAALRSRLALHVRSVIAELEYKLAFRNRPQSQAVFALCDDGGTAGGCGPQKGRYVFGDPRDRGEARQGARS